VSQNSGRPTIRFHYVLAARDYRLARLPDGRATDREYLTVALIERCQPPLIEGEAEEVTNGVARIGANAAGRHGGTRRPLPRKAR